MVLPAQEALAEQVAQVEKMVRPVRRDLAALVDKVAAINTQQHHIQNLHFQQ